MQELINGLENGTIRLESEKPDYFSDSNQKSYFEGLMRLETSNDPVIQAMRYWHEQAGVDPNN